MKQKKRGKRRRPEPIPERDDVHVSKNRCPFCHEGVDVREGDWLICELCLARHHEACWEESQKCSSCGSTRRLRRRRAKLKPSTRTPAVPILIAGVAAMLLIVVGGLMIRSHNQRALRIEEARQARARDVNASMTAAELARMRSLHEEELRQAALERMTLTDRVRLDAETEQEWEDEVLAGREEQRRKDEETLRQKQIDDLMRAAKKYLGRKNYARALNRYKSVLELAPKHHPAHHSLGAVYMRLGDYAAAIAACDRALELQPTYAVALVTRGTSRRLADDAEGAIADYDAALAMEPRQLEAINNRGVVKRHLGRLEDALVDFDMALRLFPHDATAHLNRGETLAALGRGDESLDAYARFYAGAPDDHPQLERVGNALELGGRELPLREGGFRFAEGAPDGDAARGGVLSFDEEDEEKVLGGQSHEALVSEGTRLEPRSQPEAGAALRFAPRKDTESGRALLGLVRTVARRDVGRAPRVGLRR